VIVLSSDDECWQRARVVYCQPLSGSSFALGLEFLFLTQTAEWIMLSAA